MVESQEFVEEYEKFVAMHQQGRTGWHLRRIESGVGPAEHEFLTNVWWPMFHDFTNLHPEYEVRDYREGHRYIDFAYIEPNFRIAIEIDGFQWHSANITRFHFMEDRHRQNALAIDGWHVLRFAYDSLVDEARLCQQQIQQIFGKWQAMGSSLSTLSLPEREVVRCAIRSAEPLKPAQVSALLGTGNKHVRKLLHDLVEKRWLTQASGNVRTTSYTLHRSKVNLKL